MTLLILGLILWVAAHLFKRVMPELRAGLGKSGQAVVAAGVIASLALMIFGYRAAPFEPVWYPPSFFGHINNLLMLLAFYVYGASAAKPAKAWIGTKIRHPQLAGFSIWAVAHLLANGDLASIILFGGLLVWAQAEIQIINRAEGPWQVPQQAPVKKEITLVIVTFVAFTIVAAIHAALGVSPFGGV